MNNKKPKKPQAYWNFKRFSQFRIYSLLIGFFIFLFAYIMRPGGLRTFFIAAGVICMLSEIPVFFLFWRCPHCHTLRPWHYSKEQRHCTSCGKEIEDL